MPRRALQSGGRQDPPSPVSQSLEPREGKGLTKTRTESDLTAVSGLLWHLGTLCGPLWWTFQGAPYCINHWYRRFISLPKTL